MPQTHRQADRQGCRAGDIVTPFISDSNDTQDQLECGEEFYGKTFACTDVVKLRETGDKFSK